MMYRWFLLLATASLAAQEKNVAGSLNDDISMDIADQTISPRLPGKGVLQLESAFSRVWFREGKHAGITTSAIRYGVHRDLEIGIQIEEGLNRDSYLQETSQGLFPLAAVARTGFSFKPTGTMVALITYLKLPFTSRTAEQQIYWSPALLLAVEQEAGKILAFKFNSGVNQEPFDTGWNYSFNVAADVKTGENTCYTFNYFSQAPFKGPIQHNMSMAMVWQVKKSFAVSLCGGSTLNEVNSNLFISAGFAFRHQ